MVKKYKSKTMAAIHETMQDLHDAGAIDAAKMQHFDEACLAPRTTSAIGLSFILFKDDNNAWRWRLVAGNGRIIATAAEGYKTKKACLVAVALVQRAGDAEIAA